MLTPTLEIFELIDRLILSLSLLSNPLSGLPGVYNIKMNGEAMRMTQPNSYL